MVCMLALVMSLGELLFNSRPVGRIGSALFFLNGSLASIPFLRSQSSLTQAFHAVLHLRGFLRSSYPYRGEDWGIWTQSVYINQRHFASGIGILLIVLIFLIDRYQQRTSAESGKLPAPIAGSEMPDGSAIIKSEPRQGSGVIVFAREAVVSGKSFILTIVLAVRILAA